MARTLSWRCMLVTVIAILGSGPLANAARAGKQSADAVPVAAQATESSDREIAAAKQATHEAIAAEQHRQNAKTYYVGDLVIPIPNPVQVRIPAAAARSLAPALPANAQADFDSLTELITTTIRPESWKETAGGQGTIEPFEPNLSLVVRNTMSVHKEIADLLHQLRKVRDVQVGLTVQRVSAPRRLLRQVGFDLETNGHAVLDPIDAKLFVRLTERAKKIETFAFPVVTAFNGQQVELIRDGSAEEGSFGLAMQAVIADQRDAIRLSHLSISTPGQGRVLPPPGVQTHAEAVQRHRRILPNDPHAITIEGDGALLFDASQELGVDDRHAAYVLVCPTIVVQEEVEERLGLARTVAAAARAPREIIVPFGMGTARIIVQEEEDDLLGLEMP